MSTTTLRLPDELKARIAEVAKQAGVTPHHFMLEAVAEKTAQAERQADFNALAEQRYAGILETGQTLAWDDVRDYLKSRAASQPAARPVAHQWDNK